MVEEKQKHFKRVWTISITLLVFSLFLLLTGVTFAVYSKFLKGTTNNIIEAGSISFSYNEDSFQGNGVKIENAYRISDDVGKMLNGANEYFDFSVNARATIADLSYQVIALKQPQSTLDDSLVKVYVTTKNGNMEVASPLVQPDQRVLTFQELRSSADGSGKIVYNGHVSKSNHDYHQEFRLRLWIANDVELTETIFNQTFSVKIKVIANEIH